MALGKSNIENARNSLGVIASKTEDARNSNKAFLDLFNDANFQKFVSETNKGKVLNDQLVALQKWLESLCSTVDDLKDKTNGYLNNQESLNG